jgi:hypothetical protein
MRKIKFLKKSRGTNIIGIKDKISNKMNTFISNYFKYYKRKEYW